MALKDFEIGMLKKCCDANESIIISIIEGDDIHSYRSRFLDISQKEKYLIIDEPSAENVKSKPISKNQKFEAFFKYNVGAGFRYIFHSQVVNRTMFKVGNRGIYAFKIVLPNILKDGERRDYFRVSTESGREIVINFNIFKDGQDGPLMNEYLNRPDSFSCTMLDLSGGGFSMKSNLKSGKINLKIDDLILANFKLENSNQMFSLWGRIKNKRRYRETNNSIWGVEFLDQKKNQQLKASRNKIMRFVINRQREILS